MTTDAYVLRNRDPLDCVVLTPDGGFILMGSRADAERVAWELNHPRVLVTFQPSRQREDRIDYHYFMEGDQ